MKLTTVTTNAPKKAAQNPVTWNPRPSATETSLVSHNITARTPEETKGNQ